MSSPSRYFHIRNIDGKKTKFLAFKILENASNGDCLFLSIMQFLKYNEINEGPRNVYDLRQKIVDYISHSSNWNRFVDTIIFNLENILPILQKKDYSDRVKREVYSNYMSKQYQYGTSAELQAASEIFDFVYVIFREEMREEETWYNCYSSEDHRFTSKMFLLFSGKPSAGHFRFLKPILPNNISNIIIPQGQYKTVDEYDTSEHTKMLSVIKVTDSSCVCPL